MYVDLESAPVDIKKTMWFRMLKHELEEMKNDYQKEAHWKIQNDVPCIVMAHRHRINLLEEILRKFS